MSGFEGFIPWKRSQENGDINSGNNKKENLINNSEICLRPYLYDVVISGNKDVPSKFIDSVLQEFFHKSAVDRELITEDINSAGKGICGTYTREVAEMKINEVINFARENNYDMQCTMEKGNKHAF